MKVTLTITLTTQDAKKLWAFCTEEECEAPKGKELKEWAAEYAATTLESTWQYDAGVFPSIKRRA